MKFERFISHKFLRNNKGSFSSPLINIAIAGVSLGVVVMILSVCILRGFQQEIRNKVVGFGSHIVVTHFEANTAYEQTPISSERGILDHIKSKEGVRHVQCFADKGGMIKTDDQIQGIVYKGLSSNFDSAFFKKNLIEGRLFSIGAEASSNEIIMSKTLADKLCFSIGDKVRTYFWHESSYKARAFKVVGIYSTDLVDFDDVFIVGDIKTVQKLNDWDSTMVGGYEVLVDNFDRLPFIASDIYNVLDYDLNLSTVVENYPSLFSWLDLLNTNIVLILSLMALVCVVSVISVLLIMIFEKTSMIGVLKTLGASDKSILKIFIYKSASIVSKGLVIGNMLALALCLLQSEFQLISLDRESYAMTHVPVEINLFTFILVSIFTLVVCLLALLIPVKFVSKISPAKSVRVE